MTQPQPSSLQYWRYRAAEVGCSLALKEAALAIDELKDRLGRKLDQHFVIKAGLVGIGFVLGIALCVAKGCASVSHEKVDGWPVLTVYEHHVPHSVMRDRCSKYTAFGSYPEACAEFNLVEGRCDIWFSADFPPTTWMVEHERMHCAGYDHAGSTSMSDFLAAHKKASRQ